MDIRLLLVLLVVFVLFIASGDNPFSIPEPGSVESPFRKDIEKKIKDPQGNDGMFGMGFTPNNASVPPYNGAAPGNLPHNAPAVAPTLQNPPENNAQPAPFRALPGSDPQSQANPNRLPALGFAPRTLRNGTVLSFAGSDVFSLDAAGNRKPLANGKYALEDGSEMYVMGGKRQIPPHYYERKKPDQNG